MREDREVEALAPPAAHHDARVARPVQNPEHGDGAENRRAPAKDAAREAAMPVAERLNAEAGEEWCVARHARAAAAALAMPRSRPVSQSGSAATKLARSWSARAAAVAWSGP